MRGGLKLWLELELKVRDAPLLSFRGDDGSGAAMMLQPPLDAAYRIDVCVHRGERRHPAAPATRKCVCPRDTLVSKADKVICRMPPVVTHHGRPEKRPGRKTAKHRGYQPG